MLLETIGTLIAVTICIWVIYVWKITKYPPNVIKKSISGGYFVIIFALAIYGIFTVGTYWLEQLF